MGRFAPLLDDGPSKARLSVPQNDQSEFLRNSPFIPQEESVATLDRGGDNLDIDLGRALNSTPRLETNAANKYHSVDDKEAEELGYRPAFVNDEYIYDTKRNARKAIFSGMAMGGKADEIRSKFADVRKRHWGGFLNYKNWGWVRDRRERKLRAQIQSEFPRTGSAAPVSAVGAGLNQSAPAVPEASIANRADHATGLLHV